MALVQDTHRSPCTQPPRACTHSSPIWMEARRLCFYTTVTEL